MNYRAKSKALCVFLFVLICSCSTTSSIQKQQGLNDLEGEIGYRKFLSLYPNQVSYIFYDLDDHEVTIAHNENQELIPASIQKIFTNYAALEVLGPNTRFSTSLFRNGEIRGGVLFGDVILVAGGDPDLTVSDLNNLALAVRNAGITEIKGDIIYDDSLFPTISQINDEQPDYAKYNQTVSSFSLDNNHYRILQNGQSADLITIPESGQLSRKNKKTLFDNYRHNTKQYRYDLSFLAKREAILPVRDPAFHTAKTYQYLLENLGVGSGLVKSYKSVNAKKFEGLQLIHLHQSDYLESHVSSSLLYSNNLVTEILMLHTASALGCEYKTLEDASSCLRSWYQERFPRQNWSALHWDNGSGLSDGTRITTTHLNAVLVDAFSKEYENQYFPSFLPVSGVAGTLRNKFSDKSLKLIAKTGTMNYVSTLAGYFLTGEKRYSFVIIINNSVIREIMHSSKEKVLRKKSKSFLKRWYIDSLEMQSRILDEYL